MIPEHGLKYFLRDPGWIYGLWSLEAGTLLLSGDLATRLDALDASR